jgi:hypothetical protein
VLNCLSGACVCVCVRERESERARERESERASERERELCTICDCVWAMGVLCGYVDVC